MPTPWKARFRTAFLLIGAVTTFAALIYGGYMLIQWIMTSEDDDRPPIIVSNGGSILFEAQDKNGRGEFTVDGFDIVHNHLSGKDTVRILVTVGGTGFSCKQGNTPVTPANLEVKELGILYSTGVTDEMIRVRASGKKFRVDPRGNNFVIDGTKKYLLFFHQGDNAWKLKMATLDLQSGDDINCEFLSNQKPTITIYQKAH